VADLHIRAMTAPEAAGQRLIAAGQYAWMADLAALLKARLGAEAAKVPTRKVPDFVLRIAGLFDKDLASVTGGLGRKHDFSSAKAQDLLGWRPSRWRTPCSTAPRAWSPTAWSERPLTPGSQAQ